MTVQRCFGISYLNIPQQTAKWQLHVIDFQKYKTKHAAVTNGKDYRLFFAFLAYYRKFRCQLAANDILLTKF